MPRIAIPIAEPFDLASTTRSLGLGSFADGRWVLATQTPTGIGTLAIQRTDTGVVAESWGAGAAWLIDRVPSMLGLDDPIWDGPTPAALRDLDAASRGLRLGASGVMHETAVKTVLGQLVTTRESKQSFRSLRTSLGTPAPGPFPDLVAFPEAATLAAMSYDELHRFGIERKRASIVIEVSRRAGRMEESLRLPVGDAWNRLLAVSGIGAWTAATLMGSVYGDRDAVITGDYHLPNSVTWALAGEPRGDDGRMLVLLEPYRPFRRRVIVMIKQAGIHAPKYGPRTPIRRHL